MGGGAVGVQPSAILMRENCVGDEVEAGEEWGVHDEVDTV
jgi:hypothetical protein